MEHVLENEKIDISNIHVYDDYGNEISNPSLLRSIAEGQEFLTYWLKRREE